MKKNILLIKEDNYKKPWGSSYPIYQAFLNHLSKDNVVYSLLATEGVFSKYDKKTKTYWSRLHESYRDHPYNLFLLFKKIVYKFVKKLGLEESKTRKFLHKVCKKHSIKTVVWICAYLPPVETLLHIKNELGVDYIIYAVDPISLAFFCCNDMNLRQKEEKLIANSKAYFVQESYYEKYIETFKSGQIYASHFPILIDDFHGFNSEEKKVERNFAAFGSFTNYRNFKDKISFFPLNNFTLNVFSPDIKQDVNEYVKFKGYLRGNDFIKGLFDTDFLVCFDNTGPISSYLPSKIIKLVSTTKPIILFTSYKENEETATVKFLKRYKNKFIFNVTKNIDEQNKKLLDWVNSFDTFKFDKVEHDKYNDYSISVEGPKLEKFC